MPEGALARRWFEDDYFDLIVWYNGAREIVRFQLCYDKCSRECSLTWERNAGFTHERVDAGDSSVWDMRAPIVGAGGMFQNRIVCARFDEHSTEIDQSVVIFVRRKLREYASADI